MVTLAEVHARSRQRRWRLVIPGGPIMGAAMGVRHVQGLLTLASTLPGMMPGLSSVSKRQ